MRAKQSGVFVQNISLDSFLFLISQYLYFIDIKQKEKELHNFSASAKMDYALQAISLPTHLLNNIEVTTTFIHSFRATLI
jgi:hypothetical protein